MLLYSSKMYSTINKLKQSHYNFCTNNKNKIPQHELIDTNKYKISQCIEITFHVVK